MIDSINRIYSAPVDTMAYAEINTLKAFLIKVDKNIIEMLPENNLDLEFRSGLIILDDVAFVLLMLQVKKLPLLTYQLWFNYFNEIDRKNMIEISKQTDLNIILFDEKEELSRQLTIPNYLQFFFKMRLNDLKHKIPWTSEDFEYNLNRLLFKYSSPISLWHGMQEMAYLKGGMQRLIN